MATNHVYAKSADQNRYTQRNQEAVVKWTLTVLVICAIGANIGLIGVSI